MRIVAMTRLEHPVKRFLPSHSSLHAVDACALYLSVTRAAAELSVTQSAVSREVLSMERFLGIKLFERVGPNLVPTDLGKHYHQQMAGLRDPMEAASIEAGRGRSSA